MLFMMKMLSKTIRGRLHEHQTLKLASERKKVAAKNTIAEEQQAIEHLQFVLADYLRSCGMPSQTDDPSPVLKAEYSHLGPTDLVEYWADAHDGKVVVKDLVREAIDAGVFTQYRIASASIYTVLRRKSFEKVGPGHFSRV